MRTSRVSSSTVRSYGTLRKPVSDSGNFTLLSDNSSLDQFAHQYNEKQKKKKRQQNFNGNVQSNKKHTLMKGLLYNPDSVMRMRNDMIHTSMVVNYVSHINKRHRTYRNSI